MLKIYLVHDIKANTYGAPLFYPNNVEALRELEQATKDPSTKLNKFPSDFNLVQIGQFHPENGTIETIEHTTLANCSSFLQ